MALLRRPVEWSAVVGRLRIVDVNAPHFEQLVYSFELTLLCPSAESVARSVFRLLGDYGAPSETLALAVFALLNTTLFPAAAVPSATV